MSSVSYFLFLAEQAWVVLFAFPPALLLLRFGVVGTLASWPFVPRGSWRRAAAALLAPLLLPTAILLCGAVFAHDGQTAPTSQWPEYLVVGLLGAHLPLGAALVWRWRDIRPFASFASITVASYSLGAAFISAVSISGAWL